MSRRSFLSFLAALAGVYLLAGRSSWAAWQTERSTPHLSRKLAEMLKHKGSARRIGLAYLELVPDEADDARLVELICSSDPNLRAQFAAASPRSLRRLIAVRQRDDFRQSRTMAVKGWILSKTELRLCALSALTA